LKLTRGFEKDIYTLRLLRKPDSYRILTAAFAETDYENGRHGNRECG